MFFSLFSPLNHINGIPAHLVYLPLDAFIGHIDYILHSISRRFADMQIPFHLQPCGLLSSDKLHNRLYIRNIPLFGYIVPVSLFPSYSPHYRAHTRIVAHYLLCIRHSDFYKIFVITQLQQLQTPCS
jgi:hypothetical protein